MADSPDEFARAVVRLFDDPQLAGRLAQAGRDRVQAAYGWDRIADTLDRVFLNTVSIHSPCATTTAPSRRTSRFSIWNT